MNILIDFFRGQDGFTILSIYHGTLRLILPLMAFFIVLRSARSLLGFRREPEVWAWLRLATGELLPVTHWENLLGRKKSADIVLDFATVSKNHAVLTRMDDGGWMITDIGAKGKVEVNGHPVLSGQVNYGDHISLAGLEMVLEPVSRQEAKLQADSRTKAGKGNSPGLTLFLLTVFQLLVTVELILNRPEDRVTLMTAFGILISVQWILFLGQKLIRRSGFEVETIAFFLITIGLGVCGAGNPGEMYKQLIAMGIGIALFLTLGFCLRDLDTAKKLRYLAAGLGVLLFLANLALGRTINGSRNWIFIGSFSFQPSELVKICFILTGASTMDRIVTRRNLLAFVFYTAFIGACLVVLNDFGSAAIFFVGFLAIALLRSSSYPSGMLVLVGIGMMLVLVLAATLAIQKFPHVADRFSGYGHVWEHPFDNKGYQQTQSLMCIASGGLFGLGLGKGWLRYVAASDTDLVFAYVCEEWGLLMGSLMIFALAMLGLFVVRSSKVARSSFYTIGATAAMSIWMVQAILNVFGTVDFLPLTGVTFPFVSNGGSSMMSCWALMAFLKACDTRQNASFAVKLSTKRGGKG
ncbi:MAG: FtsW/RodA/SpoVE family cell cycle protein [Oscillospiraceae bacterium]|nr:FtsW/RodA/SpoVE family cell cycle protein [Oscillospiraceae bacterium]